MNLQKNISLKNFSTFKIGGPAKFFCEAGTLEELEETLVWAGQNEQKFVVLGGGSNILFMDSGFDGLVIKIQNSNLKIQKDSAKNEKSALISCGAGTRLMELVNFSVKNGLTGLEWAVGIPGSVGGAIRGNAGAFGGEMQDCVCLVNAINIADKDHPVFECRRGSCGFAYRNSIFKKKPNLVVWECEIELGKGDVQKSKEIMDGIMQKRKQSQPQLGEFPSLGSVFKNPTVGKRLLRQFEEDKNLQCKGDKVPAGWLIEQCDLKGKRIGDAMVSPLQANFIVNAGNATSEDILILLSLIKMKVRNEFGVQLEEEIQIVN